MGELLGRLKVRTKMLLLMTVAIICLLATQALSLNEVWHDMNAERQDGLIKLTDVASSLIKRQEILAQSTDRTVEEAQAEALADLRSLRYGNNEYFFVLDTQFNMLMHPTSDKLDGSNVKNVTDPNGKLLMQELARMATTQGQGFVDYEWNRAGSTELVPKLSFASYHPHWDWILVTGVYTDDIVETFKQELWFSTKALLITLIVFGVISNLITKSIVTPVNELQSVIGKVSDSQDLTLRAQVSNHDEFGQMAHAFNDMLDSFQQLILEITSATSQVSSSAIELSATTEQTKQGMEQQQNETILVATAMNQMNATVHEVTQNTQEAANASRDAAEESQKGQEVVNSAIVAVQSLSTRLTESSKITQTLKEESDNISNILSVINGIAEQTNLLALNAAIEAARAGEQGRGFAVVADEVRSLSARTAESTKEIAAVIERLQSGTEAAANAMLTSSEEANSVVDQTLKAGDSLTKITNAIERIDQMTIQIASASEQQSSVAEEINHNIDNINNVSREGAVGANQIAQASEELAKLAEHLKETSEKFVISPA